jgi:hypothetical protein
LGKVERDDTKVQVDRKSATAAKLGERYMLKTATRSGGRSSQNLMIWPRYYG